jgi:hypothetical protein
MTGERLDTPTRSIAFEECQFCGLLVPYGDACRNTRVMKEAGEANKGCFAALIAHGGGECTADAHLSKRIQACVAKRADRSQQQRTG